MSMVSPVNLSIGVLPYFPSRHEYISASQTRPKSHMHFGNLQRILLCSAFSLSFFSMLRICSAKESMVPLFYHQCNSDVCIPIVLYVVAYVPLNYLIPWCLEIQYPLSLNSKLTKLVNYSAWVDNKQSLLHP